MRAASRSILGTVFAVASLSAAGPLQTPVHPPHVDTVGMHPEVAALFEDARTAAREAPDDPEAWWRLGAICDAHDLVAQAAEAYGRAHSLAPDDFRYLYLHAIAADLAGAASAETLRDLEAAIELRPEYAPLHVHLGDVHARAGALDEALAAYRRAVALAPNLFAAHRSLGQVALARGEVDTALQHLEVARAGAPEDRAVNASLAQVYMRLGRPDEARRAAAAARDQDLELGFLDPVRESVVALAVSTVARLERAKSLRAEGDVRGAIRELEAILRLHPESAEAHARLGGTLLEVAPDDEELAQVALGHLRRAVALHPGDPLKRLLLGQALLASGVSESSLYSGARKHLAAAVELDPDDAEIAEYHAQACARVGELELALREFERASDGDRPLAESSYVLWGGVLAGLGRMEDALAVFLDATLHLPDSPHMRLSVGIALEQLGRLEEALASFEKAARMGAPSADDRADAVRARLGH